MLSDRLDTLDEFGGRKFVIPAEVRGRFRTARNWVYGALLLIFLGTPWVKINGLQALWIDVPQRRFAILGHLFLAHDTPLLFLILAFLAMMLAFVTAVAGRVWCGWACPQTVFIDAIYRRVEIWVEGDYIARRKRRASGFTLNRLLRSGTKWALYFVVSSVFAHSFIAYFSGSERLIEMIQRAPERNWDYFLLVTSVTALLLFNFCWFREQFCLIMCPYGRFQSVLMDADSVNVVYDVARGEPRKGAAVPADQRGDCVSCNRCVQVCPTAIDIRNGTQLECIGCTACIDACDEIMVKVGKPTGLIGYRSLTGQKFRISWRAATYLTVALTCVLVLSVSILRRQGFAVTILRAMDTPYQQLPNDMIMNHYKAHVLNQSLHQEQFQLELSPEAVAQGVKLTQGVPIGSLDGGQSVESHFFLTFPKAILAGRGEARLEVMMREAGSGITVNREVEIVGP